MRLFPIAMIGVVWVSGACTVDVPEPQDGLFACNDNRDCADEYFCENGFCRKEGGGSECGKDTDCPSGVCVAKSSGDGVCLPKCDAACEDDRSTVCASFKNPEGVTVSACLYCNPECTYTGEVCQVDNGDFVDQVMPSCACDTDQCQIELGSNAGCVGDPPTCQAGTGQFSISGKVSLNVTCGPTDQQKLRIHLVNQVDPTVQPVASLDHGCDTIGGSVDYEFHDVGAGEYLVRAFVDGNDNGKMDVGEPNGAHPTDGNGDPTLGFFNQNVSDADIVVDAKSCSEVDPCPAELKCDVISGRCRSECPAGELLCAPPALCALREVTSGNLAYLCLPDPCADIGLSLCSLDCVVAPVSGATYCADPNDTGSMCGRAEGCVDPIEQACFWDGQHDRAGRCVETCNTAADCSAQNNLCLPGFRREILTSVGRCVPPPTCGAECPGGYTCAYADDNYTLAGCVPGCGKDTDCLDGACVLPPNRGAGLGLVGECRSTTTGDCPPGFSQLLSRPSVPDNTSSVTVCAEDKGYAAGCGTGHCDVGVCVAEYDGIPNCLPRCNGTQKGCLDNERCVAAIGWDGIQYIGAYDVCTTQERWYGVDTIDNPTNSWTRNIQAGEGPYPANNITGDATALYVEAVNPGLVRWGPFTMMQWEDGDGNLVSEVFDRQDPTGNSWCPIAKSARTHLGAGEVLNDGSGRRVARVLLECPSDGGGVLCSDSGIGAKPYLASARLDHIPNADPRDCSFSADFKVHPVADNVSYVWGALDDGYLAVVAQQDSTAAPHHSIRIAQLIDESDASYVYWAAGELFFAEDWQVEEIQISSELVAWIVYSTKRGEYEVGFAPVRTFFSGTTAGTNWQPTPTQIQKHFDPATLRDLTVDQNWVAWTLHENSNDQSIEYAALALSPPGIIGAQVHSYPVGIYAAGSGDPNRAQGSLSDHYLAITGNFGGGYAIRFCELSTPYSEPCLSYSMNGGHTAGLPALLNQPWAGATVWIYNAATGEQDDIWFGDYANPKFFENFDGQTPETLQQRGWELWYSSDSGDSAIQVVDSPEDEANHGKVLRVADVINGSVQECAMAWTPAIPSLARYMGSGLANDLDKGSMSFSIDFDVLYLAVDIANIHHFVLGKGHSQNSILNAQGSFFLEHVGGDLVVPGQGTLLTPLINVWHHVHLDVSPNDFAVSVNSVPRGTFAFSGLSWAVGLDNMTDLPGRILFGSEDCANASFGGEVFIDNIEIAVVPF